MRRLHPDVRDLPLEEAYAGLTLEPGTDRAAVAIGMVASVDGGAAVGGVTADLGGEADRVAFRRLRGAADAILVGAGTVRDEDYGPPGGNAQRRADRVARGLAERPRLVIVTGSMNLAADHRVFGDPDHRPLIVTHGEAPSDREQQLAEVAEVVRVGDAQVDLPQLLRDLRTRGYPRVLCEGGPSLNGALLAEDLIDEVFLTVVPSLLGGDAARIVTGATLEPPRGLDLVSVHEHDGELLLRYRRAAARYRRRGRRGGTR